MKFTLSTAITLLTCAIGSVSATLSSGSALGSRDVSPEDVAAAYEAGLPDPRTSKRSRESLLFSGQGCPRAEPDFVYS